MTDTATEPEKPLHRFFSSSPVHRVPMHNYPLLLTQDLPLIRELPVFVFLFFIFCISSPSYVSRVFFFFFLFIYHLVLHLPPPFALTTYSICPSSPYIILQFHTFFLLPITYLSPLRASSHATNPVPVPSSTAFVSSSSY